MKIVIVGLGSVGFELVQQLLREEHEITAIENDERAFNRAENAFDIRLIKGNGASEEKQRQADVPDCDLFIAVTQQDEINMLCALISKKLGAKETAIRLRNPEYYNLFKKGDSGLDLIVNPEFDASREIANLLRHPLANSIEPFLDGLASILEITITENGVLDGKQLKELPEVSKARFLVCAVKRGGNAYIPNGNFVLQADDTVHISVASDDISTLVKDLGIKKKAKRALIVGGGRTALYLTRELRAMGVSVKIIENDPAQCKILVEEFSRGVEIIEGDGNDHALLKDEGLLSTDAFIPWTSDDGQNVLLSLYAKAQGAKKVITRIDKSSYSQILENGDINSVLSLNTITANEIIKYVRSKTGGDGGNIKKFYRIINDDSALLEFTANSDFNSLGIPLKDIQFAKGVLIAGIKRGTKFFVPRGLDFIQDRDGVLISASTDDNIDELNAIISLQ